MDTEGSAPGSEEFSNRKKEKTQYGLAAHFIGLAESLYKDIDAIFPTEATHKEKHIEWWVRAEELLPGDIFRRFMTVLDLSENMKKFAVDGLDGIQWENSDYGKEPGVSVSELIEKKGKQRILADFYLLATELGKSIMEGIMHVDEADRTPEMYHGALEIPAKLFRRSCELIGEELIIEDEED